MSMNAALIGGLVLLLALWCGPLPALIEHSFTAHMTVHLLIVGGAGPLIAIGLAGRPRPRWSAIAVIAPIPAALVELIVVWLWHSPALHQAARREPWPFVAEQLSFLVAGVLFWTAIVGALRAEGGRGTAAAIAALAMTLGHMTWLAVLLSLSPRPLYGHGGAAALADQQRGGAVMLVVSGILYVSGGLVAGHRWLRATPSPETAA